MAGRRPHAVVALCLTALFLLLPSALAARDHTPYASADLPLLEEVIAQPFTVSVISSRHGVFNATLSLRHSPNFPECLHGELIPVGEQRRDAGQIPLGHFNYSRLHGEGGVAPHETATAHPSLLTVDIQLDFSGATAGSISAWLLPAELGLLKQYLLQMEEKDIPPTAMASFSFFHESKTMLPSTLSDVPEMAQIASGTITTSEEDSSGTFTFRFFSEHEFSLYLLFRKRGVVVDRVWVHGYVAPDNALLPRPGMEEGPWWKRYGIVITASLVFVMRTFMVFLNTRKRMDIQRKKLAAVEAMTKKGN